jgi:hypothetical protein
VQNVIAEGIEPAGSFPTGPYVTDKMRYINKRTLEFETPPDTEGLGTASRLQSNRAPIRGAATLIGKEPSLIFLSTRLSEADRDLVRIIINQVEKESSRPDR